MVLLRARRVEVFVPPKNGQELLKRASEENFSMFKYWSSREKLTDYIVKSEWDGILGVCETLKNLIDFLT
jgi:hypothetical protein